MVCVRKWQEHNTDFFFPPQKSKLKLFHGRTHSKGAVKYSDMTKQELGKKLQTPFSRYDT